MTVRMTHPDLDGEIAVASSAVGIHKNSRWVPVPGQDDMGEEYPPDAQRFDGQEQVRLHNPTIEGDPVITVARSAVPSHQPRGWLKVDEEPEPEVEADLEDLTVEELKERARDAGLPVSGTKAELIERLSSEPADDQDDDDDDQPAGPASEKE